MRKKDYLKKEVKHIDIKSINSVDIINAMKDMSFSARDLAVASDIYDRMLKDKEKTYKLKHPEYDSPWEKRQKDWRDFIAKIDKTYERYPSGRAYGKKKSPVRLRYKPEGGAVIEQ